MNEKADHIAHLLQQRLTGNLTQEDQEELEKWYAEDPANAAFAAHIQSARWLKGAEQLLNDYDGEKIRQRINAEFPLIEASEPIRQATVHRTQFLRTAWFRYAAAIIILFGIGIYVYTIQTKNPQLTDTKPIPAKTDVLPGTDRAVLTLSNGQQVILDSAASGTITDGTLSIENTHGQLIYSNTGVAAMNTMTTPKGGQYQLTLADGTKVWINAASSITYPTMFLSGTRQVTITGEAYFEVKPNKEKPFIVKTRSDQITVLGTAFNVNAYEDEAAVKTSLLEGIVKVGDTNIKPGQAYQDGKVNTTNTAQDVAWKDGRFDFNNLSAEEALRQLGRWYDVDIKIQGDVRKVKFGGGLDRGLKLSQVLKGLEGIGGLHFTIEGRTIIVSK